MTIAELNRRMKSAVSSESEAVDFVLDDRRFKDELIRRQQERLFEGVRADGTVIEPGYTLFTKRIKSAKGQPTDKVTLFDTGAFYWGMFVERKGDSLLFSSSDSKTKDLEEKYGEAIFGLTDYDKEAMRSGSGSIIARWLKARLGI